MLRYLISYSKNIFRFIWLSMRISKRIMWIISKSLFSLFQDSKNQQYVWLQQTNNKLRFESTFAFSSFKLFNWFGLVWLNQSGIWLVQSAYSHHSIKRTGSIKQPGLEFFKKSPLNVMCDPNLLTQQLIVLSLLNDLI